MWIRGRQVGGRTFCWARESYRFSDYDFKAASRDGYGEDWPISYAELAPYYDRVESFIGVSGSREGLDQFPDGQFLPPMALSCGALLARDVIGQKFGWRVMPDRVANLTVSHRGGRRATTAISVNAVVIRLRISTALGDAACCRPDRQVHAGQRRGRQPRAHRFAWPCRRRALHRSPVASASRGLARVVVLVLAPWSPHASCSIPARRCFRRASATRKASWPLPDGPFHRRRRRGVHAGPALVLP